MVILQAKDFSTREELERRVGELVGRTPIPKPDYQIKGTREELVRLRLSDRSSCWGIGCVITDTPTLIKKQNEVEKPQRGEIKEFGINGKNNKIITR